MESVCLNRDYVARINLKTECKVSWEELIFFALAISRSSILPLDGT